MSNTAENLAAVERELAADVAMAEGRADAEDATLPEPAADFIYLDYAATAPLCAEAASAMAPFQVPGPANLAVNANANALYGVGRAAFDLLESARRRAARALGARRPDEIVFTSGATEADDAAVLGLVQAAAEQRRLAGQKDRPLHVVTSAIEHDAVLAPCRRLEAEAAEAARLAGMYAFERELAAERGGSVVIGLDEVGRGPLAGPLAVGGVVLNADDPIAGLNDSKQVRPEDREAIAEEVRRRARAWTVQYVEPADIDRVGMTAALRQAFTAAIAEVEAQGVAVDVVLLDGNPLHLDPREVNVVKGDGKCASIAAASLVAKVARDHVMEAYAEQYPGYGFESNKGYGSEGHMAAIRERGLCPIHRRSFCSFAAQESLF